MIKWKDFPENEATWESEKNIPKFIKLYYETPQNLGKNLPNPQIKRSKKIGKMEIYHFLCEGEIGGQWLSEDIFNDLEKEEEEKGCNTRKDADKVSGYYSKLHWVWRSISNKLRLKTTQI